MKILWASKIFCLVFSNFNARKVSITGQGSGKNTRFEMSHVTVVVEGSL